MSIERLSRAVGALVALLLDRPQACHCIMDQLIPVINRLFEVFEAIEPDDPEVAFSSSIDLPKIVVVGSQSSGKSSVLESLVMRDFLPRGKDIVTRRPLILKLVHRPVVYLDAFDDQAQSQLERIRSKSTDALLKLATRQLSQAKLESSTEIPSDLIQEWGEFGHLPGQKFYDFHLIRREIEKETMRVAGSNKGISRQPINLSIFSPNVVNLTLVDLPGITKIPVGDQPDDIESQIRDLVYEHVTKPNSIILAVTPANADLANSDALKIAREVDPTGSRTIGVLTKLDLMDSGTDAMDILQNCGSLRLKLGFIGVVNRSQHDINLNRPVSEALKSELDFFKSHPHYRTLIPRCGSAFLARELNKILLEHIREQLPELKCKINQLIVSTQSELQSYGDLGLPGKAPRGTLLLKLITTYVTDFQEAIQGTLKSASTSSEPVGGARINQIFNEIYSEALQNIEATAGLTVLDVRNAIRNATGPRPSLFVPEASFEVLTRQQIGKLEAPAQRCVDLVHDELQRLAMKLDRREFQRFPRLAERLAQATAELLRERLDPTMEMVENLIKIELAYINTSHPDFWKSGSAISTLARIMEDRRRRETGQMAASFSKSQDEVAPSQNTTTSHNQMMSPPVSPTLPLTKPGTMPKDEGGILSYLFRGSNPVPPTSRIEGKRPASKKQVHQPSPTKHEPRQEARDEVIPSPLSDMSEKEEVETRLIISLIQSYFSIVRKNLLDTVPKTIMCFLVNHVAEHLPTKLVTELYKDDKMDELLQEDEGVVRQRERCKVALEAYRQAATLLAHIRDAEIYK